MGSPSDGFLDLVRKAQEGDRAAMDQVLDTLRPHLEPMARPYADSTRPAESTSDLLQESCLRAWQKIDTFDGAENDEETFKMFRAWIGQIVKNLGLDAKRDGGRKRRKPSGEVFRLGSGRPADSTGLAGKFDARADDPSPSQIARGSELAQRIEGVLKGMPDRTDASIIRLYFYDGTTITDIAKKLDLPYHRVRDRFWVLMKHLKSDLKDWL